MAARPAMAQTAFPLQHKKMRDLVLPFMRIGVCEMTNCATENQTSSFALHNTRNRGFYSSGGVPFMSDVAGVGLCDGAGGAACSSFIAPMLERAFASHAVIPDAVGQLRREMRRDDPFLSVMQSALSRDNMLQPAKGSDAGRRVVTEWAVQQYAMLADALFFDVCRQNKCAGHEEMAASGDAQSGSRAVWFTAAVAPAAPPHYLLDVLAGNVGDARVFGVARHEESKRRSALRPSRVCVVPLSADHRPLRTLEFRRIISAGGVVRSDAGDLIDGCPLYNVSRSFGHWCMKNNRQRSPVEQKLIALPSCCSWGMRSGDALVLCNRAVFATRHGDDSSLDEIAAVVERKLNSGAAPVDVAAAICDFSVRFGSTDALQAAVAVAVESKETRDDQFIAPGPIYANACRHLSDHRTAFCADCRRCRVTPAKMLELRWRRVRELLELRHTIPLMPFYGKECAALQQAMDEEAILFDLEALRPPYNEEDGRIAQTFAEMSKALLESKERASPR